MIRGGFPQNNFLGQSLLGDIFSVGTRRTRGRWSFSAVRENWWLGARGMSFWSTLLDVVVVLSVAWLLGAICERLRQSAILGYLLAGMLVGPHALDVVSSQTEVRYLAELGVALLLFTIGLEFSWSELRGLGRVGLGGGVVQILVTGALTSAAALLFGCSFEEAVVLGSAVALSSTASVLRVLRARSELDSIHGRQCLGILLVQDMAVVPLVLLVGAVSSGESGWSLVTSMGRTVLVTGGLVLVMLLFFRFVAPWLLRTRSVSSNRELSSLLALVSGLGASVVAHHFGLSPALGAFVAGIVLAESPFADQIRADVAPLRTLLVTLFFSSIGMLANPGWMMDHWLALTSTVCCLLLGKGLIVWMSLRVFRATSSHALATGVCVSQIGEFSFVITEVARDYLSPFLFSLLVSTTLVTMFLTPFLVSSAPHFARIVSHAPRAATAMEHDESPHYIVVGCGPAGRVIVDALLAKPRPVTVVDLNSHTIQELAELGCHAFVGDASQHQVLSALSVPTAAGVIIALPDPRAAEVIIRRMRQIAPHTPIIVRARYERQYQSLSNAGATVVVNEEKRVGRQMLRELRRLVFPDEVA